MKTLEIYGDSILKGIMFSKNGSKRYTVYESGLEKRLGSFGVKVANRSRMGFTVVKGEAQISSALDGAGSLPDSVFLLEYGGNDAMFDWGKVEEEPDQKHLPATEPERFVKVYSGIVDKLRSLGASVFLATLVPIDPEKYFSHIAGKHSGERIMRWLGSLDALTAFQEKYDQKIKEIAAGSALPLIDLRGLFISAGDLGNLLCDDGIHPTAEGHRLIENYLTEAFSAV